MSNDCIPAGYLRVTECLKPYTPFDKLDPDSVYAMNVRWAADRGRRVHNYCEAYAQGLFVEDIDPDCKNYVEAFKYWFDDMVTEVIFTEQRINHAGYRLSGAIDLVAILKGDDTPSIIDIKTPKNISPTWALQTGAYRILLREEVGIEADRRLCLILPKYEERGAQTIEYRDHDCDERLFINALEIYRYMSL